MKTIIIAEIGVNHNGDINLAKKIINQAAKSGVDFVKFQTFQAHKLATKKAVKAEYQILATGSKESQLEMLSKLEISEAMHYEIIDHCRKCNINFMSTAFDEESLDFLAKIDLKFLKIPSGEITNIKYLRHIAGFKKKIILSTGMATLGEIEMALNVLEDSGMKRNDITVMHCTTEYPAPMHEVNLKAMKNIGNAFNVSVGYSDHTLGIEVAIAAVALGASIIEKHFTLDRNLPGPDQACSLEPHELKDMVFAIRNIEIALGDGIKKPTISEEKNKLIARKSLVACCLIKKGEKFTLSNITAKRPGTGISPIFLDNLLGINAKRDFNIDELIEL